MIDEAETALADAQVNDPSANPDASEPSDTTIAESAETPEPKPTPGTPDKVMQRMQQELGNATREIAALKEQKADTGLTDAQKQKLAKAEQRVAKIRNYANRPDREEFPTDVDPIAEHVLELEERLKDQDATKAELKEVKAQLAYLLNDHGWDKARGKYPMLDVDAIWEKAQKDANEILGEDATPRATNRIASKYFEERCEAAKKRQGEDPKPKKDPPPSQQYKVGAGQSVAPVLSETEAILKQARSLVVET